MFNNSVCNNTVFNEKFPMLFVLVSDKYFWYPIKAPKSKKFKSIGLNQYSKTKIPK